MPVVELIRRLVHAVLPVDCAACGAPLSDDPVPFFCRLCWAHITPLHGPVCARCGAPFASGPALTHSPGHLCGACRLRPPSYTRAWSNYPYEPPLQKAIQLFKYEGKVTLAGALGGLMVDDTCPLPGGDVVMPVPLHPSRLRDREFNQSLLLADAVARRLRLPVSYSNLVRLRETAPQTTLSRTARQKNLRRAFAVLRPAELTDQRIILVDDVYTTGTTVNECAKALRKAGAADVYVWTLARTV